jgi:hypothetical protein
MGGAPAESGAPAAGAAGAFPRTPEMERIDGIKGQLVPVVAWEAELGEELNTLDVELSEHWAVWERALAAHRTAVERVTAKREAVRAEIIIVENELDDAVNEPVSGGRDPTEWLPDELMLMVLERVPFAAL